MHDQVPVLATSSRFPHGSGATFLACSHDSKVILSGGADAVIRTYPVERLSVFGVLRDSAAASGVATIDTQVGEDWINEEIPVDKSIEINERSVTCLAANHKEYFASGSEDGKCILFSNPGGEYVRHLTSFPLAIRSIDFHPNGEWIAVAGDELEIRLVNLQSPGLILQLAGHMKSLKRVLFEPKRGRFMASIDCDGTVKLWDVGNDDGLISGDIKCIKTFYRVGLPSRAEELVSFDWNHDMIAVGNDRNITILKLEANGEWNDKIKLGGNAGHSSAICTLKFQQDSEILVSVGLDHKLVVWDLVNFQAFTKFVLKGAFEISDLLVIKDVDHFHALLADKGGQVIYVDRIIDKLTVVRAKSLQVKQAIQREADVDDDLNELFEDSTSLEPLTSQRSVAKEKKRRLTERASREADFSDDILDSGKGPAEDEEEPAYGSEDDLENLAERSHKKIRVLQNHNKISSSMTLGQAPFQSGCTFIPDSASTRSYLCLDRVGSIIRRQEGADVMMDVQYHDKSKARPLHLMDYYGWSMGAMGDDGVAFACPSIPGSNGVGGTPSTVQYIPFHSWAAKGDWTFSLNLFNSNNEEFFDSEDSEDILGLAIGSGFLALATSYQQIRILSDTGRQIFLFSLDGPVVSLAAKDSLLAIIHHTSPHAVCIRGIQDLTCTLFDVKKYRILCKLRVKLTSKAKLEWMSFSEGHGTLVIMDSFGAFQVLSKIASGNYFWMSYQLVDAASLLKTNSKLIKHSIWPIALTPDLQLICTIVKVPLASSFNRQDRFPLCSSSAFPIMHQVEMAPSLVKEPSERKFLHSRFVLHACQEEDDEVNKTRRDRILFELLKQALEAERPMKAYDIYRDFQLDKSRGLAVRLAQMAKLGSGLVERMQIFEPEDEADVLGEAEGNVKVIKVIERTVPSTMGPLQYLKQKKLAELEERNGMGMTTGSSQLQDRRNDEVLHGSPTLYHEDAAMETDSHQVSALDAPQSVSRRQNPFAKAKAVPVNPLAKMLSMTDSSTIGATPIKTGIPSNNAAAAATKTKSTKLGSFFKSKPSASEDPFQESQVMAVEDQQNSSNNQSIDHDDFELDFSPTAEPCEEEVSRENGQVEIQN